MKRNAFKTRELTITQQVGDLRFLPSGFWSAFLV